VRGWRLLISALLAAAPEQYKVDPMRRTALERAGLA
jgi:hypothetical protein